MTSCKPNERGRRRQTPKGHRERSEKALAQGRTHYAAYRGKATQIIRLKHFFHRTRKVAKAERRFLSSDTPKGLLEFDAHFDSRFEKAEGVYERLSDAQLQEE